MAAHTASSVAKARPGNLLELQQLVQCGINYFSPRPHAEEPVNVSEPLLELFRGLLSDQRMSALFEQQRINKELRICVEDWIE